MSAAAQTGTLRLDIGWGGAGRVIRSSSDLRFPPLSDPPLTSASLLSRTLRDPPIAPYTPGYVYTATFGVVPRLCDSGIESLGLPWEALQT
eukprot:gene4184-biopygen8973